MDGIEDVVNRRTQINDRDIWGIGDLMVEQVETYFGSRIQSRWTSVCAETKFIQLNIKAVTPGPGHRSIVTR
jgi:hypothetical protein